MNYIKTIFDACYKIFCYEISLCGFQISLLNVFAFGVIVAICFYILRSFNH